MARRSKRKAGNTGKSTGKNAGTNTGAKQPSSVSPTPAEAPLSVEDRRNAVMRKLMLFMSDWRRCPRRACRRGKACMAKALNCATPPPPERELTQDQEAAAKAHLKRALERRLAELRGAKGSGR